MVELRISLFGGFEARLASGSRLSLPTRKAQALLAYLGVRPDRGHSREKLAALLWGEKRDDQARGGLRHALVDLRRALADIGDRCLRVEGQTLALVSGAIEVDVVTFERLIAERTPQALEHAADLYSGDLLMGFSVKEPLFEEWLVAERERLREMALEALARLLAHQTKAAATERAIQTAVRLLTLDPLQEVVHRALMSLYARQGRRGAALKQYQLCITALRQELGTEPEEQTRKLYHQLLRRPADAVPARDTAGNQVRPRSLGRAALPDLPGMQTPLFGRESEMSRLRQLLDGALMGRGGVATVLGEAGIGKSRLVSTLVAESTTAGCRVLIGRCHESDTILPFGPWVDACRGGGLGDDRELLAALHPARRAELVRLFPEADAGGLPPASDSALPLFESVAALVAEVAARQPLVLVLEDLHWADEISLRLLAFVSRRVPGWRLLLIATAREEELAHASMLRQTLRELARGSHGERIALAPLSRSDTGLLVRALAPAGGDPPALARMEEQVWVMSEGNPFVAVEATHAIDRDALMASGRLALPGSVRDLVARRLDQLSARSQELATVAAVIGRRFDFSLLALASHVDELDAAEAVDEMVRQRVLQTIGNELDFTHDRIRKFAYERILPPQRRLLHRAVAEALESAAAAAGPTRTAPRDRPPEQIEQLAYHALHGELHEKAVHYLRRAGNKAAARSAQTDAREWLEQALAVLTTLPESQSVLEEAFEIRLELGAVLDQLGEIRLTLEHLKEAEAIANRLSDDRRCGRVCASQGMNLSLLGKVDEALVAARRALAIAGRLGDMQLRIWATSLLEHAHFLRGDYADVVALATENLALLPTSDGYLARFVPPSVWDRVMLVKTFTELGRFAEGAALVVEAIRFADPMPHRYPAGLAHWTAGALRAGQGDWAAARPDLEQGVALLRTANVAFVLPSAIAHSAWVLARLGETQEARLRFEETEQLLERLARKGVCALYTWNYCVLGYAALQLARLEEARRLGARALALCSPHPGLAARVEHLLGDIVTQPDDFDAATGESHYRRSLALAEPRGMRPLIAHGHLGLGKLYRRSGKRGQAQEHLAIATTMFVEMEMTYWQEQAQIEIKSLV